MRLRRGFSVCGMGNFLFQSFSFDRYRFLGIDNVVFNQIHRHKVDEILIISPYSNPIINPFRSYNYDFFLNNYLGLPIIIGGNVQEKIIFDVLEKGCVERFMFSGSLQNKNNEIINKVKQLAGRQSIVGCLTLFIEHDEIYLLNHNHRGFSKLKEADIKNAYDLCDEVIFQDVKAYGSNGGFRYDRILKIIKFPNKSIINGGCSESICKKAQADGLAAVYFDNMVMHSEK